MEINKTKMEATIKFTLPDEQVEFESAANVSAMSSGGFRTTYYQNTTNGYKRN